MGGKRRRPRSFEEVARCGGGTIEPVAEAGSRGGRGHVRRAAYATIFVRSFCLAAAMAQLWVARHKGLITRQ